MEVDQSVSNTPEDTSSAPPKNETVSYDTHRKLLGQRKADQARLDELQKKLLGYEQQRKDEEEQRLVENENHKKIAELRKEEVEELKGKLKFAEDARADTTKKMVDTWKLSAFYDKLPGKIKKKEYLNFVDRESIIYDQETGTIDDSSVDKVVNDYMERYGSDCVDTGKFNSLPGDAPQTYKKLSYDEWYKLPPKERKERMSEVINET